MTDPRISKEKFIEYVAPMAIEVEDIASQIIAQACRKTNYGRNVQGRNLFKKEWTEDCGYPYVEITQRIWDGFTHKNIRAKIRKYRSWEESVMDYELNGEDLRGIINLYDLTKYDSKEVD